MAAIKLGELLIKAGVLNDSALKSALAEQKKWGGRLGDILVRMGLLTEDLLVRALAKQLGIPALNLDQMESIPAAVRDRIPARMARDLAVVPVALRDDNRTLLVAMSEPQNLETLDQIRAVSNARVAPQVATKSAIVRAVKRFYGGPMVEQLSGPEETTGSLKLLDAQNKTRVTQVPPHLQDPTRAGQPVQGRAPEPPPPPVANVPPAPRNTYFQEVQSTPSVMTPVNIEGLRPTKAVDLQAAEGDPLAMLVRFEEQQKRELATVRAVVELLIEKGYFTRDEYLAKMKR